MTSRPLVDPELLAGIALFPEFDLADRDIAAFRAGLPDALPPLVSYARDDVTIERIMVPGPAGAPDVAIILYRPLHAGTGADADAGAGPLPLLLNIHGGGYILGSAAESGPGDVRTAAEVGCVVASVDYRLAPETVAPGAVEDCYAALHWLHANAGALSLDPRRFAVGGASAGGGLAAALALLARDRGEIPICFQLLIYPMLDDRTATQPSCDRNPFTGEFIWTRTSNLVGWRSYLGHEPGAPVVAPYAVPARAANLAGLPPAYITVGMLDLFLEEDLDYARRLMHAGVPTELHVLPGAYHGFELASDAALARRSERDRRAALAQAFASHASA